MRISFWLFYLLFSLLTGVSWSASLNGHFKSLNLYQRSEVGGAQDIWLSADTLRFDLRGHWQDVAPVWDVSLEQLALYRDPRNSLALPERSENRLTELAWDSRNESSLVWQTQIDRLGLIWEKGDSVLKVGRQGIGFGRISLFSPLDIIAPFSPTAFDNEVRPGVDALRIQYYFGVIGEVGASLVMGKSAERSSLLADITVNVAHMDILLILGRLRDRSMAGIGLAGQLAGLGLKSEIATYQSDRYGYPGADVDRRFNVGGFEIECRLPIDLILQIQYLYNGVGTDNPMQYPLVAKSAPLQEGLSHLLGRDYLMSALSTDITPLIRCSGLYIRNLNDSSWMLRPLLTFSLADNVSLELSGSFYQGGRPLVVADQVIPQSEFGLSGNGGAVLLKLYF